MEQESASDVIAPPGRLHLTTASLPEADRLAIWQEVHGRTLFNLGVEPSDDEPFHAAADILPLGIGAVSRISCSPSYHYVNKDYLPTAQDAMNIIVVQQGRFFCRQRDQSVLLGPGEAVAMLANEVGSTNLIEGGTAFSLRLPIAAISPLVPDLSSSIVRRMDDRNFAVSLLSRYCAALIAVDKPMDSQLATTTAGHLVDLVASGLGPIDRSLAGAGRAGVRHARKKAIKDEIARNLASHTLSPEDVALRLGVTPRYIRKLLQEDGTSFSDIVRYMRLQLAYRYLLDRRRHRETITSIAYLVGYSDLSYFNRRFRAQFNMTPTEVREQLRRQAPDADSASAP
jgi:AraC-like DNA-binding protein